MKYNEYTLRIIEDCLAEGGSKVQAANVAGVSVATIYHWAKTKPDFMDMIERVGASIASDRAKNYKHAREVHKKRRKKGAGYVYLVHCDGTGFFKIGISKTTPLVRLSVMQSGCPFDLHMIHIAYCDHYSLVESILHDLYRARNVRGEWFDMTGVEIPDIIEAIDTYATAQIGLF